MNDKCYHNCGFKTICALNGDKTESCSVWREQDAQKTRKERIFGLTRDEIARKQGIPKLR